MSMFSNIQPTKHEIAMSLPGDDIIPDAAVVMDRAFTLDDTPEQVWPWFMQLGKNRAGWYFPHWINWLFLPGSRGLWHIEPSLQNLTVGKVIDDWGGKHGYFEVAELQPPYTLVHKSTRGKISMSWAITLWPVEAGTRVIIRLRLGPVQSNSLLKHVGGMFDLLTIAGLRAGLQERVKKP